MLGGRSILVGRRRGTVQGSHIGLDSSNPRAKEAYHRENAAAKDTHRRINVAAAMPEECGSRPLK